MIGQNQKLTPEQLAEIESHPSISPDDYKALRSHILAIHEENNILKEAYDLQTERLNKSEDFAARTLKQLGRSREEITNLQAALDMAASCMDSLNESPKDPLGCEIVQTAREILKHEH